MYHKLWYDKKRSCWMIQLVVGWQFSLGVHVDFKRRYIDFHILWFTISVGYRAPYTDYFASKRWDSRGGIPDGQSD